MNIKMPEIITRSKTPLFFNIGPEENFANKIDKLNERLPNKIELSYVEKQNWLGPILSFVLPFY